MADELLRDDAKKLGYIKTKNNRGYGDYAREYGILTSKQRSNIEKTEKVGFTDDQLEAILHHGLDSETRKKYSASED